MLIDRQSRPWIIASGVLLLAAVAAYVPYVRARTGGPSGGSVPGLVYGIAGSAMIVIAALLGARKRVRTWRVGRVFGWTQAHVWLGTLSYPIILLHAGFAFGGTLTTVLMWIFTAVWLSGFVGLAFQQVLPSQMLREVPAETVGRQIARVVARLREEAEDVIQGVRRRQVEVAQMAHAPVLVGAGATGGGGGEPEDADETYAAGVRLLGAFYDEQVRPLLADRYSSRLRLAAADRAAAAFIAVRQELPPALHGAMDDLRSIVFERRQLRRQQRLHAYLHGWLLIHVPLSYAMLILSAVHAVGALRYAKIG